VADAQTISGEQLCTLTGLSDRRHRQLAKDGYFPPPMKGQYQLTLTLQGMFRYYRDLQSRSNDEFAMERLRKTRAEANLAEIKLAKERKEALDCKSVMRTWENIAMVIRQKMLALPSKVAPRLVYMDDQKAIEADLDKEVTDSLEELSKPQTYDDATNEVQEGDEQSDSPSEATTET
jgi:phage terminase Nu1 subunit (DNA packaging protein)